MANAQTIIDQVKQGMGPEELARKNSWKDLSGVNLDELLKTAVAMEDKQQSYNFLVYLFRVSFDKDLWFSTEVLSQAIQHPIMTLLDHQAILPTLRNHLNKIKDQIGEDALTEEKLVKYWQMEASYYAVNGNMLAETGQKAEAVQNYQIAQSIFEQLGHFQQASKYKVLSWRVQGNDIQKMPVGKTSPIKFRLPPTQPFSQSSFSAASEPVEAVPESQKPTEMLDPRKVETRVEEPTPEVQPPSQAVAERPAPDTASPADQSIPASPEAVQAAAPSENDTPAGDRPDGQAATSTEPGAVSALPEANLSSAFLAQSEGMQSSEYYYPLPDVWMKDGQLHILGLEKVEDDEALRLKKQIQQECDILMGVQLLSQMYLARRIVLEREVKKLEKRAYDLRQRVERLENKTARLEDESLKDSPSE